jgi:DNA-binding MarR family transcriptional regulator
MKKHRTEQIEHKVLEAIDRVDRALRALLRERAMAIGVSPIQASILRYVADERHPPAGIGELAREFGVTAPTVSEAVTSLESKRLVAKRSSPKDPRRVEITPTAKGRRLVELLEPWKLPAIESLSHLSSADKETLLVMLLRLIESFQQSGVVSVARICFSCRYFEEQSMAASEPRFRCGLLGEDLPPAALRVDCSDWQAAGNR